MASKLARYLAAQAWQAENTRHIEMNSDLAEAFADILDKLNIQEELQNILELDKPEPKATEGMKIEWEKTMDDRKENG